MYYMVLNTTVYTCLCTVQGQVICTLPCHAPIMDNSENNQLRFYRVYNIILLTLSLSVQMAQC